jgi:RND superfamily putative drug exporter
MFQRLGNIVIRYWKLTLVFWIFLAIVANSVMAGWINRLGLFAVKVPGWSEIAEDGEFAFLPKDMPSLKAEDLFRRAFPSERLASNIVIVMQHPSSGIDDADRDFISKTLVPRLEAFQNEPDSIILKVRAFDDNQVGKLLDSTDNKATLIIVELKNEFLDHRNRPTIDRIQELITPGKVLKRDQFPTGSHLALSGPATVGRDMLVAAEEGARSTETWTMILVIGLLLAIYRAPFLALIPLVSVFVAVHISMATLVLLTWAGKNGIEPFTLLKPFVGLKIYIAVVVYGAGVDYCLFLVARYKEELDRGQGGDDALKTTLCKVGHALVASAGTVMCGIGMMTLALFGKFQQAGIGMSFSLLVMLVCSLTFTPALIKLAGKYAFWPQMRGASLSRHAGWISGTNVFSRWVEQNGAHKIWEVIGDALIRRPAAIWLLCVALMLPFAIIGVVYHGDLSYGLLSELPPTNTSVIGAKAVQDHFAAGETGPLTALIYNPDLDFNGEDYPVLESLIDELGQEERKLGLADIRSAVNPLGLEIEKRLSPLQKATVRGVAKKRYISDADVEKQKFKGKVLRVDLVLEADPFSRDSIQRLTDVEARFRELLKTSQHNYLTERLKELQPYPEPGVAAVADDGLTPAERENLKKEIEKARQNIDTIPAKTEIYFLGTTASIRDLKHVTDRDQIVIDCAVLLVVFLILVVLLKMFSISAYLVLSVFFSYFVSLGVTIVTFWAIDPAFAGIDWKVPIFLFTILIAVGEDYNIFLMARIHEDQVHHGPVEGIRTALLSTGSIISSCGIIMAGTFFSLVLAGTLRGSQQLGWALTFGVLLDTFVVRPILVPAWLILVNENRFGATLSRLLGSQAVVKPVAKIADAGQAANAQTGKAPSAPAKPKPGKLK